MSDDPDTLAEMTDAVWEFTSTYESIQIATTKVLGINTTDLHALAALARRGPLTAGQIGAHLGIASGAVTALVDRLERKGFLQRLPDPADQRRIQVALTENGRVRIFQIIDMLDSRLRAFMNGYSEPEQKMIKGFIDRVNAIFREQVSDLLTE